MKGLRIALFSLAAAVIIAGSAPAAAQVNLVRWTQSSCAGANCAGGAVADVTTTPYLGQATDLHLEFPLFNRPTNSKADIDATLVYDSQFWGVPSGAWAPQAGDGWWLRTPASKLDETLTYGSCGWNYGGYDDGSGEIDYYSFTLQEPDGTVVPIRTVTEATPQPRRIPPGEPYWDCPSSDSLPETFPSGDGKGFSVVLSGSFSAGVTGVAYDRYGDNVTDGFTDREGNRISVSSSALTDPLGTALTIGGSPSSTVTYTYTSPTGTNETITVPYESIYVTGSFGCYSGWSGYIDVPSEIEYPDGRTYSFTYDSAGRLASMTEPWGATVSYSYNLGVQCSPFYITDGLTETNSLAPGASWSWSHDTSSNQTTETGPNGFDIVTTLDSYGAPAQVDESNGSQVVQQTAYSGGINDRTATIELCSSVTDPCSSSDTNKLESSHTVVLDGDGFVTSTSDTDWGTDTPGPTLRQTANTYQGSGYGEVLASAEVEDGSGNEVSKTTFTSFDANGNPTTENDYVTNSAYLTTTFAYNTNGTLSKITAPNNAQTTFASYACGSGLFPQTVTNPVGTTTGTWYCGGGVPATSVDLNAVQTTYSYDNYWRPNSVATVAGTQYFDYPAVNEAERYMTFGSSEIDSITTLDGLGRPVLQQTRQSPSSNYFDSVQTTYDSAGNPATVSMPYTGTLGETAPSGTPVTTNTFDGLGRVVKVVDGGGGETDYSYTENDTLSTVVGTSGAPSVSRQEQMDGLGRLESVCEINSATGTWAAGACGQTVSASGYLTAYTRDALGQIAAVAQDSQSGNGGEEARSFSFDQLGRLTEEVNPETGTTAYTYDTDSACGTSDGDLVKRVDNAGNVTCYAYDQAHRVTEITYPTVAGGFATPPAKYFVYDSATVDGTAMAYAKGRLAEAYTGSPTSKITDLGFSYDAVGRPTEVWQDSPNSGGYYATSLGYYANGAPDGFYVPGLASEVAYSLDGEGRVNAVSYGSSPLVYAESANYPHGAAYTALGLSGLEFGSGDYDTFTYDLNTGRASGWQSTVGSQADTGQLQWYGSGELETMQITDNITGSSDSQDCGYTFDALGRIAGMGNGPSGSCLWSQSYSFDPFGNLNKSGTGTFNASYNLYNQIVSVGNVSGVYDADGDLQNDPTENATKVNEFDPDGKPETFENVAVKYDALDRPVEAGGQEFVYAPDGSKVAVMSGQSLTRADIPLPGGAEAVFNASGVSYYRHSDWLGSARLSSSATQTLDAATAYAPFGEEETGAAAGYRDFTGKTQDIANGQAGTDPNGSYDFPAREYSPTQSRWWSPDPAGLAAVDPEDPQSWNRDAYGEGIPTGSVDPSGLCDVVVAGINSMPSNVFYGLTEYADSVGAEQVFPFANHVGGGWFGVGGIVDGALGVQFGHAGAQYTYQAIMAAAQSPGPINIATFSGGAESYAEAWAMLPPSVKARIGNVTYISPGHSSQLPTGSGDTTAFSNPNTLAGPDQYIDALFGPGEPGIGQRFANYAHNGDSAFNNPVVLGYLNSHAGTACPNPQIFGPPPAGSGISAGWDIGGPMDGYPASSPFGTIDGGGPAPMQCAYVNATIDGVPQPGQWECKIVE